MTPATLSFRIDLPNGSRLGPGKIALLESVRDTGSISAAARDLEMSYRRAWLLIDDMNRAFAEAVVITYPGRSQGMGAQLSAFGDTLVALYREAERTAEIAARDAVVEITRALNRQYTPGALTRSRPKTDDGDDGSDPPA